VNLANVAKLATAPVGGTWYRAVRLPHLATALATGHTRTVRSRFNAGPLLPSKNRFRTSYLAGTHLVALYECGAMFGVPWGPGGSVPNPRLAMAVLNVTVTLSRVCDLTDPSPGGVQAPLATNAQELTGDWDGWHARSVLAPTTVGGPTGIAPTQELGMALQKSGVEGFISVSAKIPTERNLVVLPDNLLPGSSVVFEDDTGAVVHRISKRGT
jgi:RES domain